MYAVIPQQNIKAAFFRMPKIFFKFTGKAELKYSAVGRDWDI
jgi:hypothetical protein